MLIHAQLILRRQRIERLALECELVVFEVVENTAIQDKIAAADPRLGGRRLLRHALHRASVDAQLAEPTHRMHARERCQPTAFAVEPRRLVEVDVRDAVAIGDEEIFVGADVLSDAGESAAGSRCSAGHS